ncbi:Hypothetical Protein FCC1311_067912 [Hondaea fermentalgiana]|uniref:Uncharacterized protein n=1 Tax=Hondaea fermentalgiana TaxID=2315210 RepID=A0A2R5GQD6_9STRA|nr:Hypothetical Protein FCC1311_067912 [Hondaea fermentalgiana]|eukprot:GBG30571.1 Hypothetical Protein FCC1311_067912 [Hondaea fermentalgiana]
MIALDRLEKELESSTEHVANSDRCGLREHIVSLVQSGKHTAEIFESLFGVNAVAVEVEDVASLALSTGEKYPQTVASRLCREIDRQRRGVITYEDFTRWAIVLEEEVDNHKAEAKLAAKWHFETATDVDNESPVTTPQPGNRKCNKVEVLEKRIVNGEPVLVDAHNFAYDLRHQQLLGKLVQRRIVEDGDEDPDSDTDDELWTLIPPSPVLQADCFEDSEGDDDDDNEEGEEEEVKASASESVSDPDLGSQSQPRSQSRAPPLPREEKGRKLTRAPRKKNPGLQNENDSADSEAQAALPSARVLLIERRPRWRGGGCKTLGADSIPLEGLLRDAEAGVEHESVHVLRLLEASPETEFIVVLRTRTLRKKRDQPRKSTQIQIWCRRPHFQRLHPLAYVLEFGAGAGKFGFHVASRLLQLEQESLRGGDKPTRIVYVLTEVHEVSVRFWKSHSALQALFDEGVLDLAVVDAAHVDGCDPIVLEMSGLTITAGQTEAPVIGVCNYLFDSLEQDAFQVRRGVLYRAQVEIVGGLGKPLHVRRSLDNSTMRNPAPSSPGRSPPRGGDNDGEACQWSGGSLQFRPQLSWTYDLCDAAEDALLARELLPRGSAVEREVLVQQLRRYQAEEDELSVLIPLGAIRVVRNLVRLCHDPADVMILVADKGFHEVEEFAKIEDPQMVMHGGVSFMMNFHFFSRFCERVYRGAHVRRTSYMDGFKAMAVMFKYDHSLRRCDAALDQLLHGFDPGQIATLHAWSTTRERVKSLDEGLALLRTADYDQGSFLEVKHVFDSVLCGPELEYDVSIDLATLMSAYYPLQTFKDVAFETGRVYMNLGDYASASALFQRSLVDCGGHPVTWLNLGVCLAHCAKPEEARAAFEASLALDPGMERTRICLNQLQVGAKVEQEQAVNM